LNITENNVDIDKRPTKIRLIIEIEFERNSGDSRNGKQVSTERQQRPRAKPIRSRRSVDF
jgi:hypothetical protein